MAPRRELPRDRAGAGPPDDLARLQRYLAATKRDVDEALDRYLVPSEDIPPELSSAMRHAALGNGKRVRPALVLAASECCGGDPVDAMPLACALEMIHTASLVHDDLPAMDDDDLRRGAPSLHRAYGEATAILAGDALILQAFQVAAESGRPQTAVIAIALLARAAGASGMAGGQLLGLRARQPAPLAQRSDALSDRVYLLKTASLIEAAVQVGALCADARADQADALSTYGRMVGLAFQAIDDTLDVEADRAHGNLNYCLAHGQEATERHAADWIQQAHAALLPFGEGAWMLHALADFVLQREN